MLVLYWQNKRIPHSPDTSHSRGDCQLISSSSLSAPTPSLFVGFDLYSLSLGRLALDMTFAAISFTADTINRVALLRLDSRVSNFLRRGMDRLDGMRCSDSSIEHCLP